MRHVHIVPDNNKMLFFVKSIFFQLDIYYLHITNLHSTTDIKHFSYLKFLMFKTDKFFVVQQYFCPLLRHGTYKVY